MDLKSLQNTKYQIEVSNIKYRLLYRWTMDYDYRDSSWLLWAQIFETS